MEDFAYFSPSKLAESFLSIFLTQREQIWDEFCDYPFPSKIMKSQRQQIKLSTAKVNGALNAWNSCKDPSKSKTLVEDIIYSLDIYVTLQMYEKVYESAINKMHNISTALQQQAVISNNNNSSDDFNNKQNKQVEEIFQLFSCKKMKKNLPKLESAAFGASVLSMVDCFSKCALKQQQPLQRCVPGLLVSIFFDNRSENNELKTHIMQSPIFVQVLENHALWPKNQLTASSSSSTTTTTLELMIAFSLACEINKSFVLNFDIASVVDSIIQQLQKAASDGRRLSSQQEDEQHVAALLHCLAYFSEESIQSAVSPIWRDTVHKYVNSKLSALVVPPGRNLGDPFCYFGPLLLAKLINVAAAAATAAGSSSDLKEASKSILFSNMKRFVKQHEFKGGIPTVKLFFGNLKIGRPDDVVSDLCRFFESIPTISHSWSDSKDETEQSWRAIVRPKNSSIILPQAFSVQVLEAFERQLLAVTPNTPTERLLFDLWMAMVSDLVVDCKVIKYFCSENPYSSTNEFFTTLHRLMVLHFRRDAASREAVCVNHIGYYYFRVKWLHKTSILSGEIEKVVIDFCSSVPFSLTYHKILQRFIDDAASLSSLFNNLDFLLCGFLPRFFTDNPTALQSFLSLPHDDAAWKRFCEQHVLCSCPDELNKTDLPAALDLFTFLILSNENLGKKCLPSAQLRILSTADDLRAWIRNLQLAQNNDKSFVTSRIIQLDPPELDFSVVPVTDFIKPGKRLSFTFNSFFTLTSFKGNAFKSAVEIATVKGPIFCFICTSMAPCVMNYENGLIFYHPHIIFKILAVKRIPTRHVYFVMLDAEVGDIGHDRLVNASPHAVASTWFTLHD